MAKRKPRKSLELCEKLKVIDELKAGKSIDDVHVQFGISKSQAYQLYKDKDALRVSALSGSVPIRSKFRKNKARQPEIDRAVFDWFCSVRSFRGAGKSLPVSRTLIKARALHEARVRGLDFKASNGWFCNWRWRFNVSRYVKLHGEAGDVDMHAAEQDIDLLRNALLSYDPSNIFNMDESGLCYRTIPNKSYVLQVEGDSRQIGRGCKAMKAKDRITVIFCTNASGSCKIQPVVIGSAKRPRCFKDTPPCLPFFNQINAWNDTHNYTKWWNEIFLPTIRKWTSQPVALLLDGFSGHSDNCTDPQKQVTVYKFPPNVTSIYQPLDQGIIAAFKASYKSKLLARLVDKVANYEQLQMLAKQLPAGHTGLHYACLPHIGDAITLVNEAWNSLSSATIAACWRHSKCLSTIQFADSVNDGWDYNKQVEGDAIQDMCSVLGSLKLKDPNTVSMLKDTGIDVVAKAAQTLHASAAEMLLQWLHLEEEVMIPTSEEECDDGVCENPDQLPPVERITLLQQVLPLSQDLHAIGCKLDNEHLKGIARHLSEFVQEQSTI